MTKHERFLQIEQASSDRTPESETADRARIAAVLEASPVAAKHPDQLELAEDQPAGTGQALPWTAVEEQVLDAPEDGSSIAIDVEKPEGQPFVRCVRCGADSTIHAKTCANCAAELDTAEQRTFNERVWEAQLCRNEKERLALSEMASARFEQMQNGIRPLPDPSIEVPPELREPLDEEGPILLVLLSPLQKPKWRWVAGATAAGLPLLLVTLGGPLVSKLGWLLVTLFFLSLLPRRAARLLFKLLVGFRRRR